MQETSDKYKNIGDITASLLGLKLINDPRTISKITGTEHLFHGTKKTNIPSILENGLLVSKSYDHNTISHKHGIEDLAKGYVFTGRTMKPVNTMNGIQDFTDLLENTEYKRKFNNSPALKQLYMFFKDKSKNKITDTLKIRIPYEDLKELEPAVDPGYRHVVKNKKGIARLFSQIANLEFTPAHTITFRKDIDPKYIKGSKTFSNGLIEELKGMPRYIAKHPGRFASGAGKLGLGLGLTGYAINDIVRRIINRKENK